MRLIFLLLFAAILPAAAEDLWVAVGDGGLRATSADGETWKNEQHWENRQDPLCGIAYGRGRFIAVGGTETTAHLLASTDGVQWKELTALPRKISAIAFGRGCFVAVQGSQLLWSGDGETFAPGERLALRSPSRAIQMACGDTEAGFRFVIIGESEPFPNAPLDYWRAVTTDGARIDSLSPQPPAIGIAYGAGHFVVVGRQRIESSHDGQNWALQPCPGDHFSSVTWTGDRFIATTAGALWTSPDALSWHREKLRDATPILWARALPAPLVLVRNPAGFLGRVDDFREWKLRLSEISQVRAISRKEGE